MERIFNNKIVAYEDMDDTYEEKGLAYITGRLSFEVAQLLLLEKLSDAKIGAVDDLDIRNRVLKNIEESRLARESSNFGDFARFEKEFNERLATKGVSKAKFQYKHNPSDNPKVLLDAVEDPN